MCDGSWPTDARRKWKRGDDSHELNKPVRIVGAAQTSHRAGEPGAPSNLICQRIAGLRSISASGFATASASSAQLMTGMISKSSVRSRRRLRTSSKVRCDAGQSIHKIPFLSEWLIGTFQISIAVARAMAAAAADCWACRASTYLSVGNREPALGSFFAMRHWRGA